MVFQLHVLYFSTSHQIPFLRQKSHQGNLNAWFSVHFVITYGPTENSAIGYWPAIWYLMADVAKLQVMIRPWQIVIDMIYYN